ncbi:ROK family transcriptional regulator [Tellurirhabdus bombi]|uniref:ROK family transcriptional regulator n=1 Tax=Tellurirhabdus bombi TaxID=2907205 RepID=UPI001F48112C|nr:ROK family transcriptional regulator [Tellurirhabdus bombi]
MLPVIPINDESVNQKSVVLYKKSQHQKNVLSCLYQEGACTLARLAETIHTSVPSITNLIEQLTSNGWVNTIGTATGNSGRRPVLFGLKPDGHYVVVLDISTHGTGLMIINPVRQIIFQHTTAHGLADKEEYLDFLVQFVTETLANSAIPQSDILAIGLAMPGLIDTNRGLNLTYPNLKKADQSLTEWLEQQLSIPAYLINDTKATALGENRFGGGQGKKHALSINIDWGVGLGIILNGEVFQGASGFAGELGHIQVDPEGELCYCGKVGCLDTITSASSLVRRVQQAVLSNRVSKLSAFQEDVSQITINHVIEAAHQGDSFAIDLLHETGYQLGKGLSIAVNLFNPEIIIVDGVLAEAAIFITNPIEQAINKYCLSGFRKELTIEVTKLNGTAKWLGTHAYVMENLFTAFDR